MNDKTEALTAFVKDIWTYEDQANPRTAFMVTDTIENNWGRQYVLINLDEGGKVTSDLRQAGWKFQTNIADQF